LQFARDLRCSLGKENVPVNKFFSFDSSIHTTLSDFNESFISNKITSSISDLYQLLEKNWVSEGYESLSEEKEFKYRAYRILTSYYYKPLDRGSKSFITNKNLSFRLNKKVLLFGRIDKVYERSDGCIEIVDYKSGQVINHSNNFNMSLKSASLILLVYFKLGICPDYLAYYYLSRNIKFSRRILKEDIIHLENLFEHSHK